MKPKRLIASKRFRLVASLLLLLHLLAVFLPPMSFQARGPLGVSPSVAALLRPLEAYGQFLYIDRGYAFFAPNPGPSHLIQVAISDGDGSKQEIMYPDLKRQWPRLLYHRHFMLTESLYDMYRPPVPELESAVGDAEELEFWRRERARYEGFRDSMLRHLQHVNPDQDVAIRRIEHRVPDLVQYREQPVSLTHPDSYRVLLDQPVEVVPGDDRSRESLPEAIPAPAGAAPLSDVPSATPEPAPAL